MASLVSTAARRLAVLGLVLVAAAWPMRHAAAADVPFVTLADGSFAGPSSSFSFMPAAMMRELTEGTKRDENRDRFAE